MSGHTESVIERNVILNGDARTILQSLPADSIDTVVTSPPYFRLRDYGAERQIGLEPTVQDWVSELVATSREIGRVLVPTGTYWLNLGDAYSTHAREGAPRKSLLGAPERLLLALIDDGWTVRNKIVWAKPNPIPSSVTDRLGLHLRGDLLADPLAALLLRPPRDPAAAHVRQARCTPRLAATTRT